MQIHGQFTFFLSGLESKLDRLQHRGCGVPQLLRERLSMADATTRGGGMDLCVLVCAPRGAHLRVAGSHWEDGDPAYPVAESWVYGGDDMG